MLATRSDSASLGLIPLLSLLLILSCLVPGTAMAQRALSNGQHLYLPIYAFNVVGGSGANFVFQWEAAVPVSPPLVQALHIEMQTNRAIVFTTDAVLIPR